MSQRYIKVGSSEEFIPVKDIYAFIYEGGSGKTVLRITLDAATKSFEQLHELLGAGVDQVIISYEDTPDGNKDILDEYTHFCLDYKCNFGSGEYFIEITKKSDAEIAIDENINITLDAHEALIALYENTL